MNVPPSEAPTNRLGLMRRRSESVKNLLQSKQIRTPEPRCGTCMAFIYSSCTVMYAMCVVM